MSKKKYYFILSLLITIISVGNLLIVVPKTNAGTYTTPWSSWSPYVYRSLPAGECAIAKAKYPARVAVNTWPGCRIAVHFRTRTLADVSSVWEIGQVQVEGTALFRLWGIKAESAYRYNGWQVFTENGQRCSSWAIGFDLTPLSCFTWNDGGANWGYLEIGGSWNVAAVWRGLPIRFDHGLWARVLVSGYILAKGGY